MSLSRPNIVFFPLLDRPDPPPGPVKHSEVCSDSVRLEWQAPAYDGGATITSYICEKCDVKSGKWVMCGSTHLTHMTVHRLREHRVSESCYYL